MDCSWPGFSAHGLCWARLLEWGAIPTQGQTVSLVSPASAGGFFTTSATWEAPEIIQISLWNYVRNQYQKIFENNPHIFKCNVTFTKRDL